MRHRITSHTAALFALALAACSSHADTTTSSKPLSQGASSDGVGDSCILGDEGKTNFSGFSEVEINLETGSPSCQTGVCLANDFRGRVSCPYGQPDDPSNPGVADPAHRTCMTTGDDPQPVTVPVKPQLLARGPEQAVYCSCRCDGPEGTGPFCACPSGFECAPLVASFGTDGDSVAGSYCIKAGTGVEDPSSLENAAVCDAAVHAPRPIGCGDP